VALRAPFGKDVSDMNTNRSYPRRLIEVDLPIARISAHARREKSIRHGHISTLHIWWARRPLAACRAVICAALWPDPADDLCPSAFRVAAVTAVKTFSKRVFPDKVNQEGRDLQESVSKESWERWAAISAGTLALDANKPADLPILRMALLDFIADFASWDNSTVSAYLETARALTQAAHEALGGEPSTRPLVVDPFAGGGSIPLEALRVGADAFASDLNPIPVLLNKVVLEYIPKYGQRLADEVRKWGAWIKEQAEKELAQFYPPQKVKLEDYHPQPKDKITRQVDNATWYLDRIERETPIAYLWARTILSEAPGQGSIPVEVPLMRSFWLAKKAGRKVALRWVRDDAGEIKTKTMEVAYCEDGQRVIRKVKRPLLEVFQPNRDSEVPPGTVARGSATCPVTGFTTKVDSVRAQLKKRRGGAADARLFAVVTTLVTQRYTGRKAHFEEWNEQGRFYRLPTQVDESTFASAAVELERQEQEDGSSRAQKGRREGEGIEASRSSRRSLVPDEVISLNELRRVSVPIYGMERWGDLFSPRQALALTTLARLVRVAGVHMASPANAGLAEAVTSCLSLCLGRVADLSNALCGWKLDVQCPTHLFARQAIGMVWDFSESVCLSESSGSWFVMVDRMFDTLASIGGDWTVGHIEQASATQHPLPDDAAAAFVTDPPYYDAVPYAYLSDFFYVWMRRTLADVHPALFRESGVPKDAEIVVDRPHQLSQSTKNIAFYERELTKAFAEGRRITRPDGVGTIVFASKTTASWEAILKAVVDAGWVITGSWPIDTEMETRVAAQGQARLASSVHLVCRPRENADGTVTSATGEWRDVLLELPKRIHEWMPRLAAEGVVGADAIFACLGPALEIFSRYSRVEKASGEAATLREYLEHVWAAVSTEALSLIFKDADAAGLEPDARLTAMWLWTLGGGSGINSGNGKPNGGANQDAREADESEATAENDPGADDTAAKRGAKVSGFELEFDAARKIAQGLGVHLEKSESVIEVAGDKARLLSVAERTRHLFGQDATNGSAPGKKKKNKQRTLFDDLEEADAVEAGWAELKGPPPGSTVLDRLHQTMILFAAGRGELMKRFLVDEGVGSDARFWKLAQSLSALYPTGTDERRWLEGVLARKKGLGL
jgi:putative DNA methylase